MNKMSLQVFFFFFFSGLKDLTKVGFTPFKSNHCRWGAGPHLLSLPLNTRKQEHLAAPSAVTMAQVKRAAHRPLNIWLRWDTVLSITVHWPELGQWSQHMALPSSLKDDSNNRQLLRAGGWLSHWLVTEPLFQTWFNLHVHPWN